ncbi:MAG: undecaprenyl/decaprenyl-phosphate alpha-N-acetylglucosaminyl 1-phosphate transferase [Parabacteroides distasonis]|nr:undecaprenyl/decaprenyl-phosphate alpha-N-acetylglucosaminyl 1-phosphate transferase [Parabacteroides distasonis]
MIFWTICVLAVGLVSMILAGILIPQILRVAFLKRLFDIPNERKIHRTVVPRLGGMAFVPVVFFSISLVLGGSIVLGHDALYREVIGNMKSLSLISCAVIMLYLVGLVDDLIGVKYRTKFTVQILCALFLVASGMSLANFQGLLFIHVLPLWIGIPFTVLLVVFIINAINLIDGIDGLASGLAGMSLLFYGFIFYVLHEYVYALVAFAVLGTVIPFFYYNVFGKAERRKKIFMGDTGTLTIGLFLSFLSLKLCTCEMKQIVLVNPLVMAFVPFMIPCLDVLRVFWCRIRNHKNPFMPDKTHIHHKLMGIGLNQHMTMISLLLISLTISVVNIFLSLYWDINFLLLFDLMIWVIFNRWLTRQKEKYNEQKMVKNIYIHE